MNTSQSNSQIIEPPNIETKPNLLYLLVSREFARRETGLYASISIAIVERISREIFISLEMFRCLFSHERERANATNVAKLETSNGKQKETG